MPRLTIEGDAPARNKPHFHFCRKCMSKWKCEIRYRKECQQQDGVYCLPCARAKNEAIRTMANH
jgi:hypothetical protein